MMWNNYVFLPAVGKQTQLCHILFTEPGKGIIEVPCIVALGPDRERGDGGPGMGPQGYELFETHSMNIHVQIDTTGHRIGCVKWISVWDMQVLSFPTWYVNMYLTSLWGAQHVLSHHQDALGSLREDRGQTPNFETQRRCLALRMAGRQRERGGHKWGLLRDHQKLMIQVT